LARKYKIKIKIPANYQKSFDSHAIISVYNSEEKVGQLAFKTRFPLEEPATENMEMVAGHLLTYLKVSNLISEEHGIENPFNRGFPWLAYFVLLWERKDFNPSEREGKSFSNLVKPWEGSLIRLIEKFIIKKNSKKEISDYL